MRETYAFNILRVGLAITFLWVGVLIWREPQNWFMVQPWVAKLLPGSPERVMIGTAIFDIIVGYLLLVDVWLWLASLLAFVHLLVVLTVVGIDAITVRDIGLATAALALVFWKWPRRR